jgi:hypothetical protein
VIRQHNAFLETQAEFFQQGDRSLIVRLGDGHDALEAQSRPAAVQHGGGLVRVVPWVQMIIIRRNRANKSNAFNTRLDPSAILAIGGEQT